MDAEARLAYLGAVLAENHAALVRVETMRFLKAELASVRAAVAAGTAPAWHARVAQHALDSFTKSVC